MSVWSYTGRHGKHGFFVSATCLHGLYARSVCLREVADYLGGPSSCGQREYDTATNTVAYTCYSIFDSAHQSTSQSVSQSDCQSAGLLVSLLVWLSMGRSVSQSVSESVSQSVSQ